MTYSRVKRETSLGLPRSAPESCERGGCPLYAGVRCPRRQVLRPACLHRRHDSCIFTHFCRLHYPSFRQATFTTPHQGFICIQPSVLCLARFALMDRTLLRRYPWLRTSPLPVTHAEIGNRRWTLAWVLRPLIGCDLVSHTEERCIAEFCFRGLVFSSSLQHNGDSSSASTPRFILFC